jgi:hypothetical protein
MNEFAVVSEGVTDFAVLKNILIGWFKDQNAEPFLKPYQPDPTAEAQSSRHYGGWENVLSYIKEEKYHDALQFADYLIIQIDSDQSEHPNFGVPQIEEGQALTPEDMVLRISQHLRSIIGEENCAFYGDRILFAICVREIECWLLPLWDDAKAAKCEGCFDTLNRALRRQNENPISPNKDSREYERVSSRYRKRKELLDHGPKNPSLGLFLEELRHRNIKLTN